MGMVTCACDTKRAPSCDTPPDAGTGMCGKEPWVGWDYGGDQGGARRTGQAAGCGRDHLKLRSRVGSGAMSVIGTGEQLALVSPTQFDGSVPQGRSEALAARRVVEPVDEPRVDNLRRLFCCGGSQAPTAQQPACRAMPPQHARVHPSRQQLEACEWAELDAGADAAVRRLQRGRLRLVLQVDQPHLAGVVADGGVAARRVQGQAADLLACPADARHRRLAEHHAWRPHVVRKHLPPCRSQYKMLASAAPDAHGVDWSLLDGQQRTRAAAGRNVP
eukprot:scaffold2297_cov102-Isochrysis_galbana.AAC.4